MFKMDQDLVVPNTALLDDDIADLPPPETIPDADLEETLDEETIEPQTTEELIEDVKKIQIQQISLNLLSFN